MESVRGIFGAFIVFSIVRQNDSSSCHTYMFARPSMFSQICRNNCSSPQMTGISFRFSSHDTHTPGRARRGGAARTATAAAAGWAKRECRCWSAPSTPRIPAWPRSSPAGFPSGVVLHDGAGIHDVAAVAGDALDYLFAIAGERRRACRGPSSIVGNPAADAELIAQHLVDLRICPPDRRGTRCFARAVRQ